MSTPLPLEIEFIPDWSLDATSSQSVIPNDLPFPTFEAISSPSQRPSVHVLLKSLASAWGFPSSYQLISQIVRQTSCDPSIITKTTDTAINNSLLHRGIISHAEANQKLFYVSLETIYSMILNKNVFTASKTTEDPPDDSENHPGDSPESEIFTISQAFPQYGRVRSQLPMTQGSFNALSNVTQLTLLESLPRAARGVSNSKLDISDQLILAKTFDYSSADQKFAAPHQTNGGKKPNKVAAKHKNDVDVDPNTLDLTESVLPGQGFVQEFNVNHLCKVPSYYTSNANLNASTSSSNVSVVTKKPTSTSNSSLLLSEAARLSKNVQLLVSNDSDNYHHSKYYYSKSYRGPGSGNYKDASLTNRIGKIPVNRGISGSIHKSRRLLSANKKRQNTSLKGFVHRDFHPRLVQAIHSLNREDSEDLSNLEVVHNNLQFNVLVNAYREISQETWACYYRVVTTDYEQIGVFERESEEMEERQRNHEKIEEWKAKNADLAAQRNNALVDAMALKAPEKPPRLNETPQLDISQRFTAPSFHKEITRHLPMEMRHDRLIEDQARPVMKKAIRKVVTFSGEHTAPQVMDRIGVVQIPNGNSIGWDNLRKYQAAPGNS